MRRGASYRSPEGRTVAALRPPAPPSPLSPSPRRAPCAPLGGASGLVVAPRRRACPCGACGGGDGGGGAGGGLVRPLRPSGGHICGPPGALRRRLPPSVGGGGCSRAAQGLCAPGPGMALPAAPLLVGPPVMAPLRGPGCSLLAVSSSARA